MDRVTWGMTLFALSLVALAEVNQRYQDSRKCVCAHRRGDHYMKSDRCEYTDHIGGLPFSCLCYSYRPFMKVRS